MVVEGQSLRETLRVKPLRSKTQFVRVPLWVYHSLIPDVVGTLALTFVEEVGIRLESTDVVDGCPTDVGELSDSVLIHSTRVKELETSVTHSIIYNKLQRCKPH